MKLDITVTVQNKITTFDGEGIPVDIWTASQTIEASHKQPLSGEMAFKDYGISSAGEMNLFFLKTSTSAKENGRIIDNDGTYTIYRIEKYPIHYEVIVRPVVD